MPVVPATRILLTRYAGDSSHCPSSVLPSRLHQRHAKTPKTGEGQRNPAPDRFVVPGVAGESRVGRPRDVLSRVLDFLSEIARFPHGDMALCVPHLVVRQEPNAGPRLDSATLS
jgi:hypothetical protein